MGVQGDRRLPKRHDQAEIPGSDWPKDGPLAVRVVRRDDGAQSIHRAIGVLRTLAMGRETGFGLTEIVQMTGLSRPTVHRILTALIAEGLVEQKVSTRRYAVGEQIQFLALSRPRSSTLVAAAEPALTEAARTLGDTIFLTQRTGLDTICVARRLGDYPIQVLSLNVGDRRPLGISSAGLAVLARIGEDEVQSILSANAPRLAAVGIGVRQVQSWVAGARRLGFAIRDRGLVPGTRALSVAINDRSGQVIAAVTVAGIVRRMSPSRMEQVADDLKACARLIEQGLARAG